MMKRQEPSYFFIMENKISVPHSPNLVILWFVLHSLGCYWICMVQGRHSETLWVCSGPFEGPCCQCSVLSRRCGRPAMSGSQVYCAENLPPNLRNQLPGIRQFAFFINLQRLFLLTESRRTFNVIKSLRLLKIKVW